MAELLSWCRRCSACRSANVRRLTRPGRTLINYIPAVDQEGGFGAAAADLGFLGARLAVVSRTRAGGAIRSLAGVAARVRVPADGKRLSALARAAAAGRAA